MRRTSGRFVCSNCGNGLSTWRLRFAMDERGTAWVYCYCDVCRCMIEFKITKRQIERWKDEGALRYD